MKGIEQETLDGSEYIYNPRTTKRKNPSMFTSISDHWRTPTSLYKKLDQEFGFNFDPCPFNEKPEFDGLRTEWGTSTFCNPPYSDWQDWVKKGHEESCKGKLVVFLVASRTDTKVFHDIIIPYATEIRFLRGRLKFIGQKGTARSAPFPSAIIIFDGRKKT